MVCDKGEYVSVRNTVMLPGYGTIINTTNFLAAEINMVLIQHLINLQDYPKFPFNKTCILKKSFPSLHDTIHQ